MHDSLLIPRRSSTPHGSSTALAAPLASTASSISSKSNRVSINSYLSTSLSSQRAFKSDPSAPPSRHVDLLDAHSQTGMSDFHARLTASGSRDYGEDVAERNMGQNGLLLSSPAVQQYYASCRSTFAAALTHVMPPPPRRCSSPSAYRRYATARQTASPFNVQWRQNVFHDHLAGRPPIDTSQTATPTTGTSIGRPKLETSAGHCVTTIEEQESSDDATTALPPSIPRYRNPDDSPSRRRAQQMHMHMHMQTQTHMHMQQDISPRSRPPVPSASALGSVRRARQSIIGCTSETKTAAKRLQQTVGIEMPAQDSATKSSALVIRNVSNVSSPQLANRQRLILVDNVNRWKQSLHQVDEDAASSAMLDHVADGRTSRRHWSITSTEPTETSEASSLCNVRPLSRCTASTSIDMRSLVEADDKYADRLPTRKGEGEAYDHDGHVQDDGNDDDDDDDHDGAYNDEQCSVTTDGSNIDAFMEKRRQRAAPEDAALIFKESQFFSGGGALPGLFDLFQVLPTSEQEGTTVTGDAGRRGAQSNKKNMRMTRRRRQLKREPVQTPVQQRQLINHPLHAQPHMPETPGKDCGNHNSCQQGELERKLRQTIASAGSPVVTFKHHLPSFSSFSSFSSSSSSSSSSASYSSSTKTAPAPTPEHQPPPDSQVSTIRLTRRQRLLALGFDYDTDDDDQGDEAAAAAAAALDPPTKKATPVDIVIEPPALKTRPTADDDAARRYREAKRLGRMAPRLRVRRVHTVADGGES